MNIWLMNIWTFQMNTSFEKMIYHFYKSWQQTNEQKTKALLKKQAVKIKKD